MITALKRILCVWVVTTFGLMADAELIVPEEGASSFGSMVVNFSNGSQAQINLSSDLKVTFDAGDMVAASDKEVYRFPLAGIGEWFYHPSIKKEISSNPEIAFSGGNIIIDNRVLILSGFPGETRVEIYALGGELMHAADASREDAVNLSAYPAGVYVIKIGDNNFKVALK